MPALSRELNRHVNRSLALVAFGETARMFRPPPGRVWVHPTRLEALYELAYLRIFVAWESFLEESFLRVLCGFATPGSGHTLRNRPYRRLDDARGAVLGTYDYVSWWSPNKVRDRSRKFVTNGPHELVIASSGSRLEWFKNVRHRVAHAGEFARRQFDSATTGLVGRRYRGADAGRFLRDWVPGVTPQERWLSSIARELEALSAQIA
jgi:hypothetical protein